MKHSLIHGPSRAGAGPLGAYMQGKLGESVAYRSAMLQLDGLTDATQVTCELADEYNGEALASETVDSDTPTGGTRFDVDATGQEITIKGLTKTVVASPSHHIHSTDSGASWNISVEIVGGEMVVSATNATTGVAIDFTEAALNAKTIQIHIVYLTTD